MTRNPYHLNITDMLVSARHLAAVFGVDTKTIRDWEAKSKIPRAIRTPGGIRRWDAGAVADAARTLGFTPPAAWGSAQVAA